MRVCSQCGKDIPEGNMFCANCGAKVEENKATVDEPKYIFCPKCGKKAPQSNQFCNNCGQDFRNLNTAQGASKGYKMSKKTKLRLGIVAGVCVAVFGVYSLVKYFNKDYSNWIVYTTNNTLYITDGDKMDIPLVSAYGESFDNEVEREVTIVEDQDKIIYANDDAQRGADYLLTLYQSDTKNIEKSRVEIASGVDEYGLGDIRGINDTNKSYTMSKDGSHLLYIKEQGLYSYNLKTEENERIADYSYDSFVAAEYSKDGTQLIYINNNQMSLWKEGEGSKQLANSVYTTNNLFASGETMYVNGDYTKIYYVTEALSLCELSLDGAEKTIDTNISDSRNIKVYDSGDIYYVKKEEKQYKAMDFVVTDVPMDASMQEPVEPESPDYPEYPELEAYEDEEEWQVAYDAYIEKSNELSKQYSVMWEEYSVANRKYLTNKIAIDICNALQDVVIPTTNAVYYHYDGNATTELGKLCNYSYGDYLTYAKNQPGILFYVTEEVEPTKIYLSEYSNAENVLDAIEKSLDTPWEEATSVMLAVGNKTHNLPYISEGNCVINNDATSVTYYTLGPAVDQQFELLAYEVGDLMLPYVGQVKIKNGTFSDYTLAESEIFEVTTNWNIKGEGDFIPEDFECFGEEQDIVAVEYLEYELGLWQEGNVIGQDVRLKGDNDIVLDAASLETICYDNKEKRIYIIEKEKENGILYTKKEGHGKHKIQEGVALLPGKLTKSGGFCFLANATTTGRSTHVGDLCCYADGEVYTVAENIEVYYESIPIKSTVGGDIYYHVTDDNNNMSLYRYDKKENQLVTSSLMHYHTIDLK